MFCKLLYKVGPRFGIEGSALGSISRPKSGG